MNKPWRQGALSPLRPGPPAPDLYFGVSVLSFLGVDQTDSYTFSTVPQFAMSYSLKFHPKTMANHSPPQSASNTSPTEVSSPVSRLPGVRRTAHACERCQVLRVKCTGGAECSRCMQDTVPCGYKDRKRERNKQYGRSRCS